MATTNYSALQVQGRETDRISKSEDDVFSHFDTDELTSPPPGPTIYTAAIVTTLGVSLADNTWISLLVVFPAWAILFFNIMASLVIIYYIRGLRDETPICEANHDLLLLGVVIFNIYNVGEIFETLEIARWISGFRTVSAHEGLTFSDPSKDDRRIVSGMTLWFKFICYVCIVLPKLFIGVLLAFYGSSFLFVSDGNESLILNTVALTFITQIDDLMYESMVPINIKACIDDLPPTQISYAQKMFGLSKPYLVALLLSIITYASYLDTCGVDASLDIPTMLPTKYPKAGKYPSP